VSAHVYRYPPEKLLTGASLGNLELFLKLTAHSDVSCLWSAIDNQIYCGRWLTQIAVEHERAVAVETAHAPSFQETSYRCAGMAIRKRVFIPVRDSQLQIVHVQLDFENPTEAAIRAAVACDVHYPAFVWPGMYKVPDMAERNKRVANREIDGLIVSTTVGREMEARVFGADVEPADTALSDRGFVRSYAVDVPARGSRTIAINLAIGANGGEGVMRAYREAPPPDVTLGQAEAAYDQILARGYVRTPDAAINRAIDWAKINALRVQHRFPSGLGFTNDPSQDIVVTRDAAWYVMGSDYFSPEFSRGMLDLISAYGTEPGGKITEFINACALPPTKSDYDLNINDDTPLIAGAVWHHFAVTRDRASLDRNWPMARAAVEWILTQISDGLVVSNSREANVWGISGWRNIIPQGQISGAVTEINAECVYALRLGAQLARLMEQESDAARYAAASDALRAAINDKLVSDRTGLYLLNIDPDGERHHDITGDQIFPVLFGVADDARKRKILDVLYSPEFWTPFGVRTVGKNQDEYDPDYGVQLLGGVWPNLTAWVGYSGKSRSPRRLVSAMRNIWRISEVENPRAYYNVVPGQFPERLSGDSFKSRGMAMSPWMPPTYMWLTYEGLLGFEPSLAGLRINPHVPDEWSWVGARDVPVMGTKLSMFYHRRRLHTTMAVASRSKVDVYDEDVTRYVTCDAPFCVALRSGRTAVVFVATDAPGTFELTVHPPLAQSAQTHRISLRAGGNRLLDVRIPADRGKGVVAAR
jgi:hypothetical protein